MHRLLIWSIVFVLVTSGIGIGIHYSIQAQQTAQRRQLYKEAVAILKNTELKEDGTYEVTEELLIALSNAEYTEPKNIILMIGDGMGFNILKATQSVYADELYQGVLSMNYLPIQSSQSTYSTMNEVTDSAAGATALSTGYKTINSTIAMDWNLVEEYKTVLELAAERGKSTGVVATKDVTDATPAGFTAHVSSRGYNTDIAQQQLDKLVDGTLDVIMGGGSATYEGAGNGKFLDKAIQTGMTYTNSFEEASRASLPLAGLFASSHLTTTDETQPTVAEMTDLALDLLNEDDDGFFLMVEGSQIDSYGHGNDIEGEMKETYDFDCAVAVAMKYVAMNPDTVLIVTADHETGGLQLPASPSANNVELFKYTTTGHTGKTVPVLAVGYGADEFLGINENVDIAMFIARQMGEKNFGYKSSLYDVRGVTYDKEHLNYVIPLKKIASKVDSEEDIRAIHVKVKNLGKSMAQAPTMKIICKEQEYFVAPQINYLDPEEEIILSYVLPEGCWLNVGVQEIGEVSLLTEDTSAKYEISSAQISGRVFGK